MSRVYTVDMDDLCDNALTQEWKGQSINLFDWLAAWKATNPNLKVTFFTIPNRTSDATIKRFKEEFEWVALAPHGWEHTRGECLSWTVEEALDKIKQACDRGIDAPIFRAPGWLIDGDVYEACRDLGYVVASHDTYRIPNSGVKEYVYNRHLGVFPPSTRRIHGHLTPVSGNHIFELHHDGWLKFRPKDEFVWPWEVAGIVIETGK